MKNLIMLLTIAPFLLGASCKKGEKLTPATQTGANTFSCKINGKVYKAKDMILSDGLFGGLNGTSGNYAFSAGAIMYIGNNADYNINLLVRPINSLGKYNFVKADITRNAGNIDYTSKSGEINFTYIDFTQRIIAGTFSFNAVNSSNPNDIITVTEGRFDMKN